MVLAHGRTVGARGAATYSLQSVLHNNRYLNFLFTHTLAIFDGQVPAGTADVSRSHN